MPKTVPSYTIQDPTASSIERLTITRQSNGAGGFVLICQADFTLVDETSTPRITGSVDLQLNAGQTSSISSFVNANIFPLIVSQQGL